MLCDISQGGVRYDSDSLYALVMISNKAKLVDHCPKTLPSRERQGFGSPGSLPRHGDIAWLRRTYRVGRGDAMTAVSPGACPACLEIAMGPPAGTPCMRENRV